MVHVRSVFAGKLAGGQPRVYGHTDASGGDASGGDAIDVPLSEKRARSRIISRRATLSRRGSRGAASSRRVASNDTPEGRARNRRVEIKIVPLTAERS